MILPLLIALAVTTITPIATPTAAVTPSASDEIKKIREVVQQKVREKLQQIVNPVSTKKGIVGKVIQTSATDITIDFQNNTRSLKVDANTVYVDIKRNKSSLDKIKIGQDILAMGISDPNNGTFLAKRIVFSDLSTLNLKKTAVIGKIVDISKSSPIFTLIPSLNKNSLYQIKSDSKTAVIDKNQKVILIPDLKSGHKVIVIMTPDEKVSKTYYAEKIINLDYTPLPTPTKK